MVESCMALKHRSSSLVSNPTETPHSKQRAGWCSLFLLFHSNWNNNAPSQILFLNEVSASQPLALSPQSQPRLLVWSCESSLLLLICYNALTWSKCICPCNSISCLFPAVMIGLFDPWERISANTGLSSSFVFSLHPDCDNTKHSKCTILYLLLLLKQITAVMRILLYVQVLTPIQEVPTKYICSFTLVVRTLDISCRRQGF